MWGRAPRSSEAQTPLPLHPSEIKGKHVTLPPRRIAKSCDRLSRSKEWKPDTSPLLPPLRLTHDQLEATNDRLFTQTIKKKEAERKKLEQEQERRDNTYVAKQLGKGQLSAMADRLSACPAPKQEALKAKYYVGEYSVNRSKVLPEGKLHDSLSRMYEDSLRRKAETEHKLHDKYIKATEPRKVVISKACMKEAADRLTAPKS